MAAIDGVKVETLTFEQVREAVQNAAPATLDCAAKDIQWMIERCDKYPKFDLKKLTLVDWVAECVKRGAEYHRYAMERKIETKQAEAEQTEKAANLEAFAKFILTQPDILKDLSKLIAAAIPFKVPIDLLMNYYTKNQQAPAEKK